MCYAHLPLQKYHENYQMVKTCDLLFVGSVYCEFMAVVSCSVEKKPLVFFRLEVARSLMKYEQTREAMTLRPTSLPPTVAVKADDVPRAVRYDNVGHNPVVVK